MSHRKPQPSRWSRAVSLGRKAAHGPGREGSGCGYQDKRRYSSKGQAKRAAEAMALHHGNLLRPYQCPICEGWHLTSQGLRA